MLILYSCRKFRLLSPVLKKLKKTFGPKSDKLAGEWMRQPIEHLHDLYSLPNTIRVLNKDRPT